MNQKKRPIPVGAVLLAVMLTALAVAAVWILRSAYHSAAVPAQIPAVSHAAPVSSTLPPSPTTALPEGIPSAEPTPAVQEETALETLLDGMTLHEKVCQLFIVSPEAITHVSTVVAAGETTRAALEQYPVGGFLYDRKNLQSQDQVSNMLAGVQSYARIPLLLTCDEEGGRVNRLMATIGTTWVGPMLDYKDQGTDTARQNAATIAADLHACGFNMDLAPVADVWSNPDNTVIGDRAYSNEFQQAAQLVAAAVEGFHAGGVAAVLKHFPGHGNTSADSHYGSAYVTRTVEELRAEELLPFSAGIQAGADAVMIGHLIVSDLDDTPAPFSYTIVTQLLREELGFQGVVMTDGLQMQAMTDHYTSAHIAVQAVSAGVDILLCPANLPAAVEALTQAVESGTISQARLDESVLRILTLKQNCGILNLS